MKKFVAIALVVLAALPPLVHPQTDDEASRVNWEARMNFDRFQSIVLVTVVDSTYPSKKSDAAYYAHATAQVVKSWKGFVRERNC
jgi:hypothetical protein